MKFALSFVHDVTLLRFTGFNKIRFTYPRSLNDRASRINKASVEALALDRAPLVSRPAHIGLLAKLKHYGIRGQLYIWICSFLKNCTQTVVLNGCRSEEVKFTLGVPQCSVLGPVLFVTKLAHVWQIACVNKFARAIALVRKFEFEVPTR